MHASECLFLNTLMPEGHTRYYLECSASLISVHRHPSGSSGFYESRFPRNRSRGPELSRSLSQPKYWPLPDTGRREGLLCGACWSESHTGGKTGTI